MNKLKKILGIALDVLIILIFAMSIVVIIFNSNRNDSGNVEIFGKNFFTVASDSMTPTFNKGDIIICDVITDEDVLEEGDVVTFIDYDAESNTTFYNTHRIVEMTAKGSFRTKGDKENLAIDSDYRIRAEVVAIWRGKKIPALGGILEFLKKPVGFICCLIIPILAIIGFQAYKLIVWYVSDKQSKMKEKLATEGPTDEMKDAIIKEYLAKQAKSEESSNQEKK